jgi:outer membrane murein-binding lipoprotein Lpp
MTTKQAITKLFCDATGILACAFAIHLPTMDNYNAPALIYLVFDRHFQRLLEFSEIPSESAQPFFNLLHEVHPVPSGVYESETLEIHDINIVEPAEGQFRDLLDALFCRRWNAYTVAKTNTLRQLQLQEFCEERLKTQATAAVAMDLDGITADSPELANTIKDLVSTNTKSLQAQVTRLTNKLNQIQDSKNQSSGANKSSARSKKKMDSSQHNTVRFHPKTKANAQKAVAVANDSNAGAKNKTLHGKGKRSKKKKSTPANSNS